ncbi:MAG: hypothetical protein ABI614_07670 [Planctomycetota bacterium]
MFEITVTGDTGTVSVSTSFNSETGQLLTLDFRSAGIASVSVTAKDTCDKVSEPITFVVYVVEVTGMHIERQLPDESWVAVPEDEVVWDFESLRWAVDYSPSEPDLTVDAIGWNVTSWYPSAYPEASWSEFASATCFQSGDFCAVGNPGEGHWAVTPAVSLNGGSVVAMLQAPKELVVGKIKEIKWTAHDHGDGLEAFQEDQNRIFAEKLVYDGGAILHDKIDVEISTVNPIPAGFATRVYLKIFDPDHVGDVLEFEPDPFDFEPEDDNVDTNGAMIGVGAALNSTEVVFAAGESVKTATMTISNLQPGNNFIISGSGRQEWLTDIVFDDTGTTLLVKEGGNAVPNDRRTNTLTVWRTLHVEEDSMGPPPAGEVFDGAGVGNDDVAPVFTNPSLALLSSELLRASIQVVVVPEPSTQSPGIDIRDNVAFVHNLADITHANAKRDVQSSESFWAVQIVAAYEWLETKDADPPPGGAEEAVTGVTIGSLQRPIYIFLETSRDVAATKTGAVAASIITERTVLHEVIHRFGYPRHDVGIMDSEKLATGTDEDVRLNGGLLKYLISRNRT